MTNKFSLFFIILVAIFTMNFRCGKYDLNEKPFEQTFLIPVDIFPLKKTYSLTDTIWIETDITGKLLFDTKSNQLVLVDTGQIKFGAGFNRFGTDINNPPNGFCDVITIRGVNTNIYSGPWNTTGYLDKFGCGQPTYKCRIGFKPLIKGTYYLALTMGWLFESCPNKVVPYYANLSYNYKSSDLGLEIFNSLPNNLKGGNNGIQFYTDKINKREFFIFKVE